MRDKPSKWKLNLNPEGINGITQVVGMMQLLWKSQLDRHGTGDVDAPISVTREESEVALHIAASLVHLFTSGAIRLMQ